MAFSFFFALILQSASSLKIYRQRVMNHSLNNMSCQGQQVGPFSSSTSNVPPSRVSTRSVKSSMVSNEGTSDDNKEKVAIIGGGIAGLSCAAHLKAISTKFEPTVFDTGRLRPGGRCSSRLPGDNPKKQPHSKKKNGKQPSYQDQVLSNFLIDHAAQIISVPTSNSAILSPFRTQIHEWEDRGFVRKFPPRSVVEICRASPTSQSSTGNYDDKAHHDSNFSLKVLNPDTDKKSLSYPALYYGVDGMKSIPDALSLSEPDTSKPPQSSTPATIFPIEQDVWISPSNGVKFVGKPKSSPKWSVKTNNKEFGVYDRLIIAHNGKCADRLMSKTPAKQLHSLLRTNFSPTISKMGGKRMTLNSIYSLTIAIQKKNGSCTITRAMGSNEVICAFVKNVPDLRFLTCQSRKFHEHHQNLKGYLKDMEVWTLFSSAKFGKKYKGPQENLPDELVEDVTKQMLSSLEKSIKLDKGTLSEGDLVVDSRLQLWGAAIPLNCWVSMPTTMPVANDGNGISIEKGSNGFVYDDEFGVGVCGDWLLNSPSGIESAWESGRLLANHLESNGESNGLPPSGGGFQVARAAKTFVPTRN